ncbi:MAG: hypothetical protein GVY08_14535 [Bacteroidetes bacterium]|nr:hypothetical protein [Bacteroidota bacterium]
MNVLRIIFFLIVVDTLFLHGCATPVAPTGGPPDRTPPEIIGTTPDVGTTNFSGNEVRVEFSKFPDRASVRSSVTIEPNLDIQFEVGFSRRTAIIEFEEELPENTTIIVVMGSDISDTRNNEMPSSFSLAFSTGPVIDEGNVTARLRDSEKGSVEAGERVFLYREPVEFSQPANYVAQSDTSGSVEFSYLREGAYSAIWVDDVNRDRRWNPERERAQPFHTDSIFVKQGGEVDLGTIYIQRPDTTSPRLEGVGLLSDVRLRLRNSEELFWDDGARFTIRDSLGAPFSAAYPLYKSRQESQILFAQAEDALDEENRFSIEATGFRDSQGNPLQVTADPVPGSAEPDTATMRYVETNAENGLFPDQPLEVTYSKFINDDAITDSLIVFEGEKRVDDYQPVEVRRHKLLIFPDEEWQGGIRYAFGVWDPDFMERRTIEPEIWQRNELGNIEFNPSDEDTTTITRLLLENERGDLQIDTLFTGSFVVENLAPVEYHAKLYRDIDENGRWDTGSIDPFSAPEPYFLRRNIPVREGFTSDVSIEFSSMPGENQRNERPEVENQNRDNP